MPVMLRPQRGPQEMFLSTPADIAIYGGAAGGGKTYALLLEVLRHINNPAFGAVIFRRQATQIMAEGGLFDNAVTMYSALGAKVKQSPMPMIVFPGGAKVSFRHLQLERDVYAWQGSQIALLAFDELTHFSEAQFFYMLSRNRSTCGVRPYVRATCNPDVDSWVASFISWWIDQGTGYAIPGRSGVLRYFFRSEGDIAWGSSVDDLAEKFAGQPEFKPTLVKSVTFIASSVHDNKALLSADPGYLANLYGLSLVEKERLLKGNWKIRPAAGLYFRREQTRMSRPRPTQSNQKKRANLRMLGIGNSICVIK